MFLRTFGSRRPPTSTHVSSSLNLVGIYFYAIHMKYEPQELSSSDTEVQVNEANVQQKKKRNRKAKRRELKGEAVSVGSPNDPIDQINE